MGLIKEKKTLLIQKQDMQLSSKIKGIFRVSASNLLSLGLSMITSFILPIFISVEEYGYWQLFVLYNSYVGFFVFGFNDGVHLNYATFDYNEELARKFSSFKNFLLSLTIVESVLLFVIALSFLKQETKEIYIVLVTVANLVPTALNGLFTYLNQATMRFNYYAIGTVIDKILFAMVMIVLLLFGIRDSLVYISFFTLARYCVILYHYFTSKLVFKTASLPIMEIKHEIVANFKNGFPLMIAIILGSSIIVGSQLLVKSKYGIETFGAFSFSIHTIVFASQFIVAIASVFYPIFKRYPAEELGRAYIALDKSSSILSALLLLSYYPIAIIILLLYTKYSSVLSYLMFVYPLFIFQCKANLLITNVYKVKNHIISLVMANTVGIVLHLLFVFLAYYIFKDIKAIAVAVLISYCLWYYIFQTHIFKRENWRTSAAVPWDCFVVMFFLLVNILLQQVYPEPSVLSYLTEMGAYAAILVVFAGLLLKPIKSTLCDINQVLKD